MKKGERLQQLRELARRNISHGMHSGCTDYYCDCHLALPECLDEIEWLQARNRELLAALNELKRWCCRPGDDGRHDDGYDAAMRQARAAISEAEGRP